MSRKGHQGAKGRLLLILLIMWLCSTGIPVQIAAQSGPAYFAGTGHWYEVVKGPTAGQRWMTWTACRDAAVAKGGYLACIQDATENAYVTSLLPANYTSKAFGGYEISEGNWAWVSGEPFAYTNWAPGEPSNSWGGTEAYMYYGINYPGQWNDGTLNGADAYVVEYDSDPDPDPVSFAVLNGRVEASGIGIPNATVFIEETVPSGNNGVPEYAVTDRDGNFEATVPLGSYRLRPQRFAHTFAPQWQVISVSLGSTVPVIFQARFDGTTEDKQLLRTWEWYCSNIITKSGRVDDPSKRDTTLHGVTVDRLTVSEGQGYGMMMAVIMKDKPQFDSIWHWTENNLQHKSLDPSGRPDNLFAWRWIDNQIMNSSTDGIDSNSATDADIDIATSLCLASEVPEWPINGRSDFLNEARAIISDIWRLEVYTDQYVKSVGQPCYILTVGDWIKRNSMETIPIDVSYFAPYSFKVFSTIDIVNRDGWLILAEDAYRLLDALTAEPLRNPHGAVGKLPPFWVEVDMETGAVSIPADRPDGDLYQHDAFRAFWRAALDLRWTEDPNAGTYLRKYRTLIDEWVASNANYGGIHYHNGVPNWVTNDKLFGAGLMGQLIAIDARDNTEESSKLFEECFKLNEPADYWYTYETGMGAAYYGNAWCWFATALYLNKIPKPLINLPSIEEVMAERQLDVTMACPTDMILIDPLGREVSVNASGVPGAVYVTNGTDNGDVHYSWIKVPNPRDGAYAVRVVPRPNATPDSTFSLFISLDNKIDTLALDLRVGDIPGHGFMFSTLDTGSIAGLISSGALPLPGVPVDLSDDQGNVLYSTVTCADGRYLFGDLDNGNYLVSIASPLGFKADPETKEIAVKGLPHEVNFELTKLEIVAQQRTRGYWAHQLLKALQNKPQDYKQADFAKFAGLIDKHFNQNQLNPVDFYQVPQPASQADSLEVLRKLLHMMNTTGDEPLLQRLAKSELMALMLNVVSGKVSQTYAITRDDRTISQVITYCDMLVNDEITAPDDGGPGCGSPWVRYIRASFILTLANCNIKVPAGMIPEDVLQIAYRLHADDNLPTDFSLAQNYPNPFNPTTTISFNLPKATDVTIDVFNIMGQKVATLVNGPLEAGEHQIVWDGKVDRGGYVATGVYLYRLQAGEFTETRKMMLLK